ncbi:MAG: dihydrodipicolinate synthase family protein, partial [Clostridia bacterium]|nr:dihydrodipicolinate synthase family protein [Clostridia bacterium]
MKTREDIKGIICAMVTPMHADESVDLEGVRRQTRRQIEAGVHGVFCLGTNGEGYILSHKEKLEVAQAM